MPRKPQVPSKHLKLNGRSKQVKLAARDRFLRKVAEGFSATAGAIAAGVSRETVYQWRNAEPEFAKAWDAAVEQGTDVLEDVAQKRAKKKSDLLMIFTLKARRPEKYRDDLTDRKVAIEFSFDRAGGAFAGATINQVPNAAVIPPGAALGSAREELIAKHPGEVGKVLAMVLEGVSDDNVMQVYERALPTILATVERGVNEPAPVASLEAPRAPVMREVKRDIVSDVSEVAQGYSVNLDAEGEAEQQSLREVTERVDRHNAKVRARAGKK